MELDDAALYQGLHLMEAKGWIETEWGQSDTGRRAKFYRLTKSGRARLRSKTEAWKSYSTAVFRILEAYGEIWQDSWPRTYRLEEPPQPIR